MTRQSSQERLFARAAYQREWDANRKVQGVGISELSEMDQERRTRAAVSAHLQDILRHHGFGKEWLTVDIPAERPRFYFNQSLAGSGCGSPAAMCAEGGGAG